ncbi:MAG: hypothetical protein GX121_02085 [Ignavibacteria bacterium]|jgi:hypothetical protein|nr:hypothetical protein [Ignavibacteria bacterium]
MKYYIIFAFSILVLLACNSETEYKTEKLSLSQLRALPYYQTFNIFWDEYNPLENIVDSVKQKFDIGKHKLIVFTSPTCYSCGNADSLSAFLLKTVYLAEIPETVYEIYSMPNYKSSHIYSDIVHLESLPAFWLFKNNMPAACISDSFRTHKEAFPESQKRIEEFFNEALNEN